MIFQKNILLEKKQKFFFSVLGTLASKGLLVLIKLGLGVMTARFLGPAGRGLFSSSVQTAGFGSTIFMLSVGEGLIYKIGRKEIIRKEVFSVVVVFSCFFSLVVSFFLFLAVSLLKENIFSDVSPEMFVPIYLLGPLMVVEYLSASALKGLKEFGCANKVGVFSKANILILVSAVLFINGASIIIALYALVLASMLNAVVWLIFVFRHSKLKSLPPLERLIGCVKYGAATHLATLLTEIEYRLDTFVLLYFVGPAAVGVYITGVSLGQIQWYLANSINSVLFPYVSEGSNTDKGNLAKAATKAAFYGNFLLMLPLIFFGVFIVEFLYGDDYRHAYLVFITLSPGLLCDTFSRGIAAWLKGVGRPFYLSCVSAGSLFVNISLNILVVPKFGILGAAAVSTITYGLKALILVRFFCKENQYKVRNLIFYSKEEAVVLKDRFSENYHKMMDKLKK